MKTIDLIVVGDSKFREFQEMEKKYLHSINYFVKFSVIPIRDGKAKEERVIREREAEAIRRCLKPHDFVIALDRCGRKMSSEQFADLLGEKISYHNGRIVFLIGGFCGLAEELVTAAHLRLSFSDMTFAHDVFRILFLEQLYRALTIIHGIKYHR